MDWSALLVVLNSPIATRIYRQTHGGASMSGRQVTIKTRCSNYQSLAPLADPAVRRELMEASRVLSGGSPEGSIPPLIDE